MALWNNKNKIDMLDTEQISFLPFHVHPGSSLIAFGLLAETPAVRSLPQLSECYALSLGTKHWASKP
ncbi:MAG: hypothetical protein C4329_09405 [Chitinophagaceae bacterium]